MERRGGPGLIITACAGALALAACSSGTEPPSVREPQQSRFRITIRDNIVANRYADGDVVPYGGGIMRADFAYIVGDDFLPEIVGYSLLSDDTASAIHGTFHRRCASWHDFDSGICTAWYVRLASLKPGYVAQPGDSIHMQLDFSVFWQWLHLPSFVAMNESGYQERTWCLTGDAPEEFFIDLCARDDVPHANDLMRGQEAIVWARDYMRGNPEESELFFFLAYIHDGNRKCPDGRAICPQETRPKINLSPLLVSIDRDGETIAALLTEVAPGAASRMTGGPP
jgi:hypothetical protein